MDLLNELQKRVRKCGDDVNAIIEISNEMHKYDCTAYQCEFYRRGLLGDVHLQREATPENVCGRTKGNAKVYSQIKAL